MVDPRRILTSLWRRAAQAWAAFGAAILRRGPVLRPLLVLAAIIIAVPLTVLVLLAVVAGAVFITLVVLLNRLGARLSALLPRRDGRQNVRVIRRPEFPG